MAGFNQNEASVFMSFQFHGKYLNSSDADLIQNIQNDSTIYDNQFAYERLTEWFDDQSAEFLACANNLYTNIDAAAATFMNGYYNESMNFNLNTAENMQRNSRALAWAKVEKMISDMHYVCSSLDLKKTMKTSGNVFNYKFNKRGPRRLGKMRPTWFGVTHGDEMEYVFGKPFVSEWFLDDDRKMSARVMNFWANFARTGRL